MGSQAKETRKWKSRGILRQTDGSTNHGANKKGRTTKATGGGMALYIYILGSDGSSLNTAMESQADEMEWTTRKVAREQDAHCL